MAQRALGEQPDITELSRHFSGIATQVERFNNLPAVAGGDRIVQAIQDMTQQLRQYFRVEIQQVREDLRAEIQQVHTALQAYDTNATARLINNHKVRAPTHELEPLVDVRTGAAIPHFPETINQLMDLQLAEANAILSALGTSTAGNLAAKRARIKRCCGILPAIDR
ncbi:hypothetical protein OQA88_10587 [Cercophora sp. LCS_1]